MKLSRRQLMTAAVGASQLALLERFGLVRDARADGPADGPTKLLSIYLQGGTRPQYFWFPFSPEVADQALPAPSVDFNGFPLFCTPDNVVTCGPNDGKAPPLQMTRLWNPADPTTDGDGFTSCGYNWIGDELYKKTAVLHGIDQGSNAHGSAYVAAMCGVAGSDYRAPALACVVANHFYEKFADTRPLPSVALSQMGLPQSRDLRGEVATLAVPSAKSLGPMLDADGATNWWWKGLDARSQVDAMSFAGEAVGGTIGATVLEASSIARIRDYGGMSTAGTDAYLAQLHDTYQGISRTLAADVTDILGKVKPIEHFDTDGYAFFFMANASNPAINFTPSFEMALRLLKSDLCTSVHAHLPQVYFDTHSTTGHTAGAGMQRASMELVGRLLLEMQLSPAPGKPGKTLLDDTLVMIFSEFGRTWGWGASQDDPASFSGGDDHHPISAVTFVGGGVAGNHMIGSYLNMPNTVGAPVDLVDESGETVSRAPRAQDTVATACRIMGMEMEDFFLPGGYGEVVGIRQT